jgi:mannan endo-1,4-beta-mannosidase
VPDLHTAVILSVSSFLQAFKSYVLMILNRINTISGVKYSEDPTIFALELANEPHTSDGWEKKQAIAPGSCITHWMKEIIKTIRSVDINHMVSMPILQGIFRWYRPAHQ